MANHIAFARACQASERFYNLIPFHVRVFFWKSLPVFRHGDGHEKFGIQAPPPGCSLPPSRGTGYPGEMHLCTPVPGVHTGSVGLRSQAIPTKTPSMVFPGFEPGTLLPMAGS